MDWFFIALIAPFFWSASNFIDKYLLSKFVRAEGAGTLVIVSSFVALPILVILYVINPEVVDISIPKIAVLILGGFISALAILFYLYAMNEDDASVVVPFFQLIPIFLYIFGYIFLGETLNITQISAGILIIAGAIILSLDISEDQKYRIKKRLVFFMVFSSALYALYETMFKFVAIEENFWVSNFWQHAGLLLFGIFCFIFINKYRAGFIFVIKNNGTQVLGLNVLNETIYTLGNFVFMFASLLAPIALVGLVNAYQPVFVLIGGILISIFLPKIAQENINKKNLVQKIIAIFIIFIGSCFI